MVAVFARPPEIHSAGWTGGRDPIGLDECAIDDDVRVSDLLRLPQRRFQTRRRRGQDVDALVQIVVGGGTADAVVDGQLSKAGAVEKPSQDEYRLLEAAQRPGPGTSAAPLAFGLQQSGQEHRGLVAHRQRGRICDTHVAQDPYEVDL